MVQNFKPLYTVKEVAEVLHVGKNTVYELLKSGQLPCLIFNKRSKRVKGTDLEYFINNCTVSGGTE